MNKKIISLFIVLVLGLFVISGCEKETVGQQVSSNIKTAYVYDPVNVKISTSKGMYTIKSVQGPNYEKCNVDIISIKEEIERTSDELVSMWLQKGQKLINGEWVTTCGSTCYGTVLSNCCLVTLEMPFNPKND